MLERGSATPTRRGISHRRRRDQRLRVAAIWSVVVVLVIVVAAVVWVGVRGLLARDALERAQSLVGDLQEQVLADPPGALQLVAEIRQETADARALTSDPVWRTAEATPVFGTNLTAVRQLATAVDRVALGALEPLAQVASTLDISALQPVDGRINLEPIAAASGSVAIADAVITAAAADVARIDTSGTLGFVSSARTQLAELLGKAAELTGTARTVTRLVPPMLGAEGARNYILMFQNNAEARPLGGNPAALILVRIENGAISIAQQASSTDFGRKAGSPDDVAPGLTEIYYPFTNYVQDVTTRPDFPTAATLAQGFWERDFGLRADGVVSFDPVALASLLDATGPVTLSTGDELNASNAVQLLLSDVYSRYEDPRMQDAFFAEAAQSIFGALTGGGFDPQTLLASLTASTEAGRLMLWSDRPDEQEVILSTPLSGVLPTKNDDSTTLGVYFMDQSSSKIDFWVDTSVSAATDRCSVASAPIFSTTTRVTSTITQEQAENLPDYVVSSWWGPDKFATSIYVLGPPNTNYLDTVWGDIGIAAEVMSVGVDLGRPVVRLMTELPPGGTTDVTVRFQGVDGVKYGPVEIRTTPMVRPTTVTVDDPACP